MTNQTDTLIAQAEAELTHRQRAQAHLKGIPARQNATTINQLYDRLTNLHIFKANATFIVDIPEVQQ